MSNSQQEQKINSALIYSGLTHSRPGEEAAPAVPRLSQQVRCFSTSVLRPFIKPVRPPVQIYGIKGRYATALYSAASKQNKLEQVAKESLRVGQILKEPEMAASIMNPYVKCYIEVKSLNDMTAKERFSQDFPGGSVVRTPRFHCQGTGFDPWSGN